MFATLLIWNVVLAAFLAGVVALAGRTRYVRERPALRHCLWLLVLCKLVTPPLIPLPVPAPIPKSAVADLFETTTPETSTANPSLREGRSRSIALSADTPKTAAGNGEQEDLKTQFDSRPSSIHGDVQLADSMRHINWIFLLCSSSLLVTVVLVVRVFVQLRRLLLLLHKSDGGSSEVNAIARREAVRMGIAQVPTVCVVKSVITPLLWVTKARPVVVLPDALLLRLTDEQIACVVRHELAHFSRRDHWSSALAYFVGCLFWWNPIVWWAQREMRMAQEACCDAMVMDGTPAIRRTYAETLLQVIEFVGGRRSTPQLTIGFGEAFSITRRFEMIANERVTHRLPPVTGLLVATLLGIACCYPVMAQPTGDTESEAVDRSVTSDTKDDAAKLGFQIELEWTPKHVATTTFQFLDDAGDKGVLTLRAEGYPKSSQFEMLKAMHDAKSIAFAKVTTEITDPESERVNVVLESKPLATKTLNVVITDLSRHFRIQRITMFPSATEPIREEASDSSVPETSQSDAKVPAQQREFFDALRSALPTEVGDTGWEFHLQGHHYYSTNDQQPGSVLGQLFGDSAEQDATLADDGSEQRKVEASATVGPNVAPETVPDIGGGVAGDNINIGVLANDTPRKGQFDPSTLTIVSEPSNGKANPQPGATITYVPNPGFHGKDSFQYTISDTSGNVSAATKVRVRVVESGLENPLVFGDVNGDGHVTAVDALLVINRLGESGEAKLPVQPTDRGPDFTDVDGDLFVSTQDALLVIKHINESADSSRRGSSLDGHWILQHTIRDNVKHAAVEQFKFYFWSFDETARTLTTQWQTTPFDAHKGVNRFVVNTTTTPKQLTVYGETALLQAIYEFDGDTLRIGVFGKSELERPASFEAHGTGKAGPLVVYELKRHAGALPK